MSDATAMLAGLSPELIVLEQPDAADGRTWLVCAPQAVVGMPTYAVVSSHHRRADALAELVNPEIRPLLEALWVAMPWLDRDGEALVRHAKRLALTLAAAGYGVRRTAAIG